MAILEQMEQWTVKPKTKKKIGDPDARTPDDLATAAKLIVKYVASSYTTGRSENKIRKKFALPKHVSIEDFVLQHAGEQLGVNRKKSPVRFFSIKG